MLNLKKVIAIVAAAALTLSTVTFAATYSDVTEDSAYYTAVESLNKLGIVTGYEDGTYGPEKGVTRAEMAALIARIQGYGDSANGSTATVFTDVPATHWASGYIAQASGQGIVNGYGDGTFGPDDAVTYEQAIKMIMVTLGYEPFAANNGGYPTGYLAAAQKYNVTKGVSNATVGTEANRGTIAQLLANAIDTPIMGQSKWATDGTAEYTIYDGTSGNDYKTLMSEFLSVVKLKGIVVETAYQSIYEKKDFDVTEDAEAKIYVTGNFDTSEKEFSDDMEDSNGKFDPATKDFLVGESNVDDFLGQAVIFYVQEDENDDWVITSIAADSTKNDIVTFTFDQYDDSSANEIRYFKNTSDSTSTKKTLSSNPYIVYNGRGVSASDIANMNFLEKGGKSKVGGQITLIDNDGKTGYDVVLFEAAATAVVDEVSDELVSFKEAAILPDGDTLNELEIEEDADDTKVVFVKDGEEIEYTDLQEWDVLSIIAPDDTNIGYIYAEVISNPVTGTITADFTSKTSAANGKGFKIDGTKYDVALNSYKADKLEVGDAGVFYIDKYGKIAAFNEDSSVATGVSGNYAFIKKVGIEDDTIDDTTVSLQLITAEGVKVLDLASSVTFKYANGQKKTLKPDEAVITGVANTDEVAFFGSVVTGNVIKYTVSGDYVKTITMADYDDKFETTYTFTPSQAQSTNFVEFEEDNSRLGKYIDESAIVFFIDNDADKCSVGTLADFDDEQYYDLRAMYADNKADDNNIVVIKGSTKAASVKSKVAIVTDAATAKNEDDEDIFVISYMQDGTENEDVETIAIEDMVPSCSLDDIPTVGDIIKVKVNSAGKVTAISYLLDIDEDGREFDPANPGSYILASNVTKVDDGTGTGTMINIIEPLNDGESFFGGAVAYAKDSSSVAFSPDGNIVAAENAKLNKLSKADNVYVVTTNGRGVTVKRGTGSSFRYIENLFKYEELNAAGTKLTHFNLYYDGDPTGVTTDGTLEKIAPFVDHVFIRAYDGDIEDVIIFQTPEKTTVKTSTTDLQ